MPVAMMLAVSIQTARPDVRDNLRKARQKWEAHRPASYEFTIEVKCFCYGIAKTPPAFRVTAGSSVAVSELTGPSAQFYASYNTVDKLFSMIDRYLALGQDKTILQFDDEFGFPTVADLDPQRDVFDDELFLRVTNFRVIEK